MQNQTNVDGASIQSIVSQPLLFSLDEISATVERKLPKPGTPEASLDKYLQRTIRRVTLFLSQEEYDETLLMAKRVAEAMGIDNHTDLFKELIRERERKLS